jgi:hypothetical protein
MTNAQEVRFMLHWLAAEETSALGECHGSALDVLVGLGLAQVLPAPVGRDPLAARVCLTPIGRGALGALKRAAEHPTS